MIDDQIAEAEELEAELHRRLGENWFAERGGIEIELTPKGRVAIHVRDGSGMCFFFDQRDGEPIVGRAGPGRAELGHVGEDGEIVWTYVPLGSPEMN